jgi:hypothetical protein
MDNKLELHLRHITLTHAWLEIKCKWYAQNACSTASTAGAILRAGEREGEEGGGEEGRDGAGRREGGGREWREGREEGMELGRGEEEEGGREEGRRRGGRRGWRERG